MAPGWESSSSTSSGSTEGLVDFLASTIGNADESELRAENLVEKGVNQVSGAASKLTSKGANILVDTIEQSGVGDPGKTINAAASTVTGGAAGGGPAYTATDGEIEDEGSSDDELGTVHANAKLDGAVNKWGKFLTPSCSDPHAANGTIPMLFLRIYAFYAFLDATGVIKRDAGGAYDGIEMPEMASLVFGYAVYFFLELLLTCIRSPFCQGAVGGPSSATARTLSACIVPQSCEQTRAFYLLCAWIHGLAVFLLMDGDAFANTPADEASLQSVVYFFHFAQICCWLIPGAMPGGIAADHQKRRCFPGPGYPPSKALSTRNWNVIRGLLFVLSFGAVVVMDYLLPSELESPGPMDTLVLVMMCEFSAFTADKCCSAGLFHHFERVACLNGFGVLVPFTAYLVGTALMYAGITICNDEAATWGLSQNSDRARQLCMLTSACWALYCFLMACIWSAHLLYRETYNPSVTEALEEHEKQSG